MHGWRANILVYLHILNVILFDYMYGLLQHYFSHKQMRLFIASPTQQGEGFTLFLRMQRLLQASNLRPSDYKTVMLVSRTSCCSCLGHIAILCNMISGCTAKWSSCSAAITLWSWISASENIFSSWYWLYLNDGLIKVLLLGLWFPVQGEIRAVCERCTNQMSHL